MDFKSIGIDKFSFRRSSAVEQLTVNQLVVGSIPTAGAKQNKATIVNIDIVLTFFSCEIDGTYDQLVWNLRPVGLKMSTNLIWR